MATLSRQTQKVFASNADADQIAVFGSMKTGTPVYSTNLATLQSTAYTEGWAEALLNDKAPYMEEMNAVQYGLSYQIAYLLQEGAPEYDINTNYSNTSIVKVIDSNGLSFYRSLVDNNLGNSLSDTDYWVLIPLANVQPQLAQKADINLANTTPAQTFKTASIGWGMPDWSNKITIASGVMNGSYTCPSKGWLAYVDIAGYSEYPASIKINNLEIVYCGDTSTSYHVTANGICPVDNGDVVDYVAEYTYGTSNRFLYFIPMKGVN